MSRININALYLDTLDEINENERGQLGVPLFNRLVNKAIRHVVDLLTGRLQDYDADDKTALSLFKTQKIEDLLFPLVRRAIQPVVAGKVAYPADYNYFIDLRITGSAERAIVDCLKLPTPDLDKVLAGGYGFRQVDVLSHDKIANRTGSFIPSLRRRPCAEQMADGWQNYPYLSGGSAFVLYLAEPKPVELRQTPDVSLDIMVYDPVNSSDPEMHTKLQNTLAVRCARYFMQYTREKDGIEIADANQKAE